MLASPDRNHVQSFSPIIRVNQQFGLAGEAMHQVGQGEADIACDLGDGSIAVAIAREHAHCSIENLLTSLAAIDERRRVRVMGKGCVEAGNVLSIGDQRGV